MRKLLFTGMIALLLIISTACGTTKDKGDETESKGDKITITHELGETDVHKNPERVVVFDFGMLDTLDFLNIEVIGVPQMNIPSYLEKFEGDSYENIGSLKEPDFEKIANIDPELIIISGRQSDLYDELKKLGPVVYLGVDHTRYMDSFKENIDIIGKIFDKEEEVEQVLNDIDNQITDVNKKAEESNKNALIILANEDKISAYGENSRFGIIHDAFGVAAADDAIEASTHGMNVTFEYVLEKNPDLLYVVDRSGAIGEDSAVKNIVENDLMERTKAMQNDDIIYLDSDVWYLSGGGIVSVQKMIEEISDSLD